MLFIRNCVLPPIFPNGNCHFPFWVMEGGCDVAKLYVLQSYRCCTFCTRKTRGETQFWIELAAPYTLANNNEMNSDDRLPFIIFLTPISYDGSNRLWRRRLLPSPCSLWRHKQTLVGVIRPLADGKCRRFRQPTEQYRFHRYLCFHCIFCVWVFCILFCTSRVTLSYQNCIHSNSTLRYCEYVLLLTIDKSHFQIREKGFRDLTNNYYNILCRTLAKRQIKHKHTTQKYLCAVPLHDWCG